MKLDLKPVTDPAFAPYGKVLEGYCFASFIEALKATELPADRVMYVPSDPGLEADGVFADLRDRFFGGMPIQVGFCNGVNSALNCLEYHRDSEIDIAVSDCILLVGLQSEIEDWMFDTAKVKAFLLPAGMAAELYATTLHYAPCSDKPGAGFQVAIVLPLGTNTAKPDYKAKNHEDTLMTAKNKWLLAHPDSAPAQKGAVVGLKGANIKLEEALW